jgi:hypothetical protein
LRRAEFETAGRQGLLLSQADYRHVRRAEFETAGRQGLLLSEADYRHVRGAEFETLCYFLKIWRKKATFLS